MKYTKLVRDYPQLVNLLSSERGLKGAPADIEKRLQDVGYYRLSAYWYPFTKKNGDSERINTSIDVVWTHYSLGIGDGKYYRLIKQGMPSRKLTSAECKRHTRRYVLDEVLTWLESMQKGENNER